MPRPPRPVDDRLKLEERKQLLVLACEADRVAWQQSCRPRRRPPTALLAPILRFLEPVAPFLPGFAGRWLQRAGFFARLGRQFGLLSS